MEKIGYTGQALSDNDDYILNQNDTKNDKRFGDSLQR